MPYVVPPNAPPECWLAPFDERMRACRGPWDPCHLIDKQALRRGNCEVWDRRLLVWGCRLHHGEFDARKLSVPRDALPESLEQLAEELGLLWFLDRRYGALKEPA